MHVQDRRPYAVWLAEKVAEAQAAQRREWADTERAARELAEAGADAEERLLATRSRGAHQWAHLRSERTRSSAAA